jgi:hypothetical protein
LKDLSRSDRSIGQALPACCPNPTLQVSEKSSRRMELQPMPFAIRIRHWDGGQIGAGVLARPAPSYRTPIIP